MESAQKNETQLKLEHNQIIDRAYSKLNQNLEEMTKVYRHLLDLVRKEKDLLIANDIQKIEESNSAKEQMLVKIRALDALRVRYAEELAGLLGCDVQNPRLLEMAQKMGGAEGEKLRNQHSTLDLVIRRLVEINRENEELTKSALRIVNGAMGEIKESLSGKGTYQRKGTYKAGPEVAGHFVRKEA